jgi:hypothetical protein
MDTTDADSIGFSGGIVQVLLILLGGDPALEKYALLQISLMQYKTFICFWRGKSRNK